ncbi:MAG: RNA-binding protein, partial [Flaviaesturariibacter sp.]|nr:RNA-binding protein [Flaviaesturariibacter sp.]
DASSVHPESYAVVERMAADLQASLEELIRRSELRKAIKRSAYISETAGEFTIDDILKELEKPGRDPRGAIEEFQFDDTIRKIEDVKVGMQVPGIVTNITAFGAFVDIGVKQDGLVHVSQLANKFVSDPNEVVKLNQKVTVTVTEVDVARKRIALTMRTAAPARASERRERPAAAGKTSEPEPSFHDKLAQLKQRFK